MSESLIKADTALESLRSSDFDTYSAYGEVLDNSIQANASNIWIYLVEKLDRNRTRKSQVSQAVFVDDGHGMSHKDLHKCLKLGHSSRYNDRGGIGRFGVGMTLGAIHEVRRIEVFSKQTSGNWQWTYIDLDEIAGKDDASIPVPINKKPEIPGELDISTLDSGTVLVWNKYDRAIDNYETILNETEFYIGRTFRKFIQGRAKDYQGKLTVKLNDKKVHAWDPLFHFQENILFTDPVEKSSLLPTRYLSMPVSDTSLDITSSTVEINVTNFSDVVRQKRGQGNSDFAKSRNINRNEGVSILRNDREVFFGHIPHSKLYPNSEAVRMKTRYIGIEISFRAELDQEFSVKNIKRGAVPVRYMKDKLEEEMRPTIKQCLDELDMYWDNLDAQEDRAVDEAARVHLPSTADVDTMKKVADLKDKGKIDLSTSSAMNDSDNDRIGKLLGENNLESLQEALQIFGVVVDKRQWPGNVFFDIVHGNGAKLLAYNTNSPVYKTFNSAMRSVRSSDEDLARDTQVIFDLIFVAMALAEGSVEGTKEMTWERSMRTFRSKWSDYLEDIFRSYN